MKLSILFPIALGISAVALGCSSEFEPDAEIVTQGGVCSLGIWPYSPGATNTTGPNGNNYVRTDNSFCTKHLSYPVGPAAPFPASALFDDSVVLADGAVFEKVALVQHYYYYGRDNSISDYYYIQIRIKAFQITLQS
ncbi:MAG: hypothetical protein FWD57_00330, partial [Polyangiaceae bacterium]|nr:hypothetical protein [Polyangiaceae bacterium]